MTTQQEFNADPDAMVLMATAEMEWEATDIPGVSQKLLERVIDDEKGRETALIKVDPGTVFPHDSLNQREDIFVLEGLLSDEHGDYGQYTFILNPAGFTHTLSSKDGCVFYRKLRNPFRDQTERLVIDTAKVEWQPFGHRAAEVVHFYRDPHGIEVSRFGEVFENQQIPSHDHAMGEETLICDGELNDAMGTYGPGTWLRFPIGLEHAPFTKDQTCKMFIREGDLVW